MSIYDIRLKFEGGCFNCPFCPDKRHCVLLGTLVQWRFKSDPDSPINDKGDPGVKIVFDPYRKRLKGCPLTKVKKGE